MSQLTKSQLQTNINTDIADNISGDITAADVRGNLIDVTDSVAFLSSSMNLFSGDIGVIDSNGTGSFLVASGSASKKYIYLGTYNTATAGKTSGILIPASSSNNGTQIIGYKYGTYLPIYFGTDTSGRKSSYFGYNLGAGSSTATVGIKQLSGTTNALEVYGSFYASGSVFKINPGNSDKEWYIDSTNPDHLKKEGNIIFSADPNGSHSGSKISFNVDGNNKVSFTEDTVTINTPSTEITGSLSITEGISGSFSGSFQGDGSNLTGVGGWDGNLNGNASITGSLTVTGDTTLKNDLYLNNSSIYLTNSTIYPGSNTFSPTVIPPSDSANIGFAIARPNNDIEQQLILNYQGGTGRIIAKETNASAPQLRIELFDGSTTTEALRFQKTSVIINTSLLPTTEPATSGQMWLSGSAGSNSKVLCVRD
jgi:hypothetical protein